MALSPSERTLRARLAAHVLHATHDPRSTTAAARRAFRDSFLAQVDSDLPEDERRRRAEHLRRAHFLRLALASAKARRARKGGAL